MELATIEADTLPDLCGPYPLAASDIDRFRRDGFVHLPNVCTPEEVAAYRAVLRRATFAHNRGCRPLEARETFRKAFLQTMQLRLLDEAAARFVTGPRFARIAAELMGVRGVRIYHDQSLFKEPAAGSNRTPWHQDLYYWPFDEATACGLWMPLVDVSLEMGPMRDVRSSHLHGYLGDHAISDQSQATYDAWIARQGAQVIECAPVKAGDALFHCGWTIHGAGANRSDRLREAMIVAYFADGMRVGAITNPAKEHDRLKFLSGRPVGELADGSLNPLVYSRV